MSQRPGHLVLADGTRFEGWLYGSTGTASGEVVFTTGMTGYQEVLTDPSYTGQIVTMTAPQIGNTGVNAEDPESANSLPQVAGFVMRDASFTTSNFRADEGLEAYLRRHKVVGIYGVDTRRLTRVLRDRGSQNGAIGEESPDILVEKARSAPDMQGLDLVAKVTPKEPYRFTEGRGQWGAPFIFNPQQSSALHARPDQRFNVVAIDYGAKRNILRSLVDSGCDVTCVPATYTASQILERRPDGVFLSSGPGDPAALPYAVKTIEALLGKVPIFGICLGHQLLGRALGASTHKLKFGHRGLNQPVKDLSTGRVEITTQNHGFVVDVASLPARAKSTHLHLNDGSSEGLSCDEANAFSVQYHPEAAAGPHDALYLFDRFTQRMARAR
jgi:carbamoyl-phosphate synthase small subunit